MAAKKQIQEDRTILEKKMEQTYSDISKATETESEKLALFYARELARQMLFNPAKQASSASTTYTKYSKEQLNTWIQSPSVNESNLRKASNYLYASSQHYQRLIVFYATLLLWRFIIVPADFNPDAAEEESFNKSYLKVANLVGSMNVADMLREIMVPLLREGVYFGCRYYSKENNFLQRLNPDICKITAVADGAYVFSVDMSKIKKEELEKYPSVFESMYNEYEKTKQKFQEVPADISICMKADSSLDYSIPVFSATLPQLYKISAAESRADVAADMDNYKMLHALIPCDENGNPKIDMSLVEKFYSQLAGQIGGGIGVAVNPFKMESFGFERSGATAEIDKVQRVVSQYWSTAGVQGTLFGITNETTGIANLSLIVDEAYMGRLIGQAERMINRIIRLQVSGKNRWKIKFLTTTLFNIDKEISKYRESASFGLGISHYAAVLDIPQYDIAALAYLENNIIKIHEKLVPLKNTYNSGEGNKTAGRPLSDNVGDAGEQTRDNESNVDKRG